MILHEVLQHVHPDMVVAHGEHFAQLSPDLAVVPVEPSKSGVGAWLPFLEWDASGLEV